MRLPCVWIRLRTQQGVRKRLQAWKTDYWARSRALDGQTRFPEVTIATRIRQAYGGVLTCENAYGGVITLRIQDLDRKTITCRRGQRQQVVFPTDQFTGQCRARMVVGSELPRGIGVRKHIRVCNCV